MSGLGAALGDIGSAVVSGLFGQHSAKKQMQFQERMANTQYQRAAVDLEKAGLNRVLALGSPAPSPAGASATMPDSKAGTSYQAGSTAKAQRNVLDASAKLTNEQALTEQSQQALLGVQAAAIAQKLDPEIELIRENTAAARTLSKRGSGVAEISDAIADVIKEFRREDKPQKGVVPYVAEKLPSLVIGEQGVNSARKLGSKVYNLLHGSIAEQSAERKKKWAAEDAKPKQKPVFKHGKRVK